MVRVNTSQLTIAVSVMAMALFFLQPELARARENSSPTQSNTTAIVESAADTFAFISWTTNNPAGTILHYAIVHYGKDPNHLDLTAASPTRINPNHTDMVFRVRMNNLEPQTKYYYKVSSTQANGIPDPATSAVQQFETRPTDPVSAAK